jgi:hypothetical protein
MAAAYLDAKKFEPARNAFGHLAKVWKGTLRTHSVMHSST